MNSKESDIAPLTCAQIMSQAEWVRISEDELRWHAPQSRSTDLAHWLGRELPVHEFPSANGSTAIHVLICEDGGIISYELPSGQWLHTIQTTKEFRRKVFELNLLPIQELAQFLKPDERPES